ASAILGFFASACRLPFDYVKSQIQKTQPNATGKYSYRGSLDCVLKTWKAGGALKFYTEFPVYCVKIAHYVKDFFMIFSFLKNSFRLNIVPISPELGYVSLVRYGMEIGRPTFVPVQDLSVTAISL
ncbi:hypothetical protein IFM89_015437, partial [Coptis chinensis]